MKTTLLMLISILCNAAVAADLLDVQLFPIDFQRSRYRITEKYPYRIIVKFKGRVRPLHNNPPVFVMDLPAEVALSRVCTRLVPARDIPFSSEKISIGGRDFTRYTMILPTRHLNYSPKSFVWKCGFDLYIEAFSGSAGKHWTVPYHFLVNGEKCFPREFDLAVLPEIPAGRHAFRKFRLSIKELPAAGQPDITILSRHLDMWSSFGGKLFMAWDWESYNYPESSRKLLNEKTEFFFWTYACINSTMILTNSGTDDLGFSVANRVTRPGVPLFHGPDGKIDPGAICPQYLMKDPEGLFYGEYLRRSISKAKKASPGINTFIIDYEPYAAGGTCSECLKDFARFAKLKKIPDRKDIKPGKPLNRAWQKYKIHQNKIIMSRIADGVKKHFPEMKVSFCSTELRPSMDVINTWDAVDVGAVEDKTDFYSFMIYSSGLTFYNYLSYAVGHLTTAGTFPWIDPSEEIERFFLRYTPEKIRPNLIAAVALNADGLMFYPTDTLDGEYMTVIAETCDILAGLEEIYQGRNLSRHVRSHLLNTRKLNLFDSRGNLLSAEYPNLNSQVKIHLHEKNGIYVVTILNYADEKAFIEVAIPEYQGDTTVGTDFINRRNYDGLTGNDIRKGFVVEVKAGGSAVIKIGSPPGRFIPISQKKIRQELEKAKVSGDDSLYKTISRGNTAIQWRAFKKNVMITLVHGENYVTVNLGANARIEEWAAGRYIPTGLPAGALGEVIFYDPAQSGKREYTVERADFSGTNPAIILKSTVKADTNAGGAANPLAGLVMEKRIELAMDGTVFITDTLFNPTGKMMQSGFRVKNTPFSVWKAGRDPVVTHNGKILPPAMYLIPHTKLSWFAAVGARKIDGCMVFTMKTAKGDYTFDWSGAVGAYFWKNQIIHTAEAVYPQFTLKPGEKFSVTGKIGFSGR